MRVSTITIATTGQQALRDGSVVGGAPVVARRQALALARCGIKARLLDIEPGELSCYLEGWRWKEAGAEVEVHSWQAPVDKASPYRTENVRSLAGILERNGSEDFLFLQEAWCGTLAEAAKGLGRRSVWQPNDYSFLCERAWFLRGNGRRCDMLPAPEKCAQCQLRGRSQLETVVLKSLYLAEGMGLHLASIALRRKCATASERAKNIPRFLSCFEWYIAQSEPMAEALRLQGVKEHRILRVDYGVATPAGSPASGRRKPGEQVTFAYIARPTYEKGLHILLEAWSKLKPDLLSRARLLVYSPLDSAARFQKRRLRRLLNNCSRVEVREGAVSSRLDAVYAEIDVAVQPSLWVDHNCQTILEALARGVPVIVPRHTSFGWGIVQDRKNGLMIDLDNPSALLEAITALVVEAGLLERLKQAEAYRFSDDDWAQRVLAWCETHFL